MDGRRREGMRQVGAGRLVPLILLAGLLSSGCPPPATDEQSIRHNILGTAYLGQSKWAEAEAAFREAAAGRPDDPLPLNNIAVALIQSSEIDQAEEQLRLALASDPDFAPAHFNMGLIEKNRGDFEKAAEHFAAVARFDPEDLLTQYNLGIVLSRVGRDDEARAAFGAALEKNPAHVSTLYGLGQFLLRRGEEQEGARLIELSSEYRNRSGLDEAVGTQYGEQGIYAMGQDYSGDALAAPAAIAVAFHPAGQSEPGVAIRSWATARRADGTAGLLVAGSRSIAWLGSAPAAPLVPEGVEIQGLAAGDLDRDDATDLVALLTRGDNLRPVLLSAEGDGFAWASDERMSDDAAVTVSGDLSGADLTLVDFDHDGDIDVYWCWSTVDAFGGCRLATNDGTGRFATLQPAEHGVIPRAGAGGSVHVGFSDVDNDRDLDLLLVLPSGVHTFANQRDGSFQESSETVDLGDLSPSIRSLAVADLNKDGFMDLVIGGGGGARLVVNRRGRFAPAEPLAESKAGGRSLIFDMDNDGFLDLVQGHEGQAPTLHRNLGRGEWAKPVKLSDESAASAMPVAAFDSDRDGDLDLALLQVDAAMSLVSNDGGNANRWISIESRGIGDNLYGVGCKVEILAGALRQKFEINGTLPQHAGLGLRDQVESVRYVWPSGVLQDEVNQPAGGSVELTQLDRKGTSCPLLYAWDGDGWRFITDFLGGAAVGYQQARGVFNTPDTDEYVKIEGGIVAGPDGTLRLRMNNQLEEVLWFDQVELLAVDHPEGSELFPNERLMPGPPFPEFELFASRDVRAVRSALDVETAEDQTERLALGDRRHVENFDLLPYKGYAEPHTLELSLGSLPAQGRVVLLLDGWIDYADSSANIAAQQAGLTLVAPRLTVADGRGGWRETGHLMGFPAGLPKTMAVELTGWLVPDDPRIRIETNMRIYWDRARVMLGGEEISIETQRLPLLSAELRDGGFPRETSPDGRKPNGYDPAQVSPTAPWKAHVGSYTAFGDVGELLLTLDDRFVTTRNGDEIELVFPAAGKLARGMQRTYLLFADGFGKDMDPNSAGGETVAPIPFHGMPGYPYPPDVEAPLRATDEAGRQRRVLPSQRGWPGSVPQVLAADGR